VYAGEAPYLLIVGPEHPDYLTWTKAGEWAAAQSVNGHTDFVLPNRREGAALFDRVQSIFKPSWYWLSEQHAGRSDYAWVQNFGSGNQDDWRKGGNDRVRAVRRSVI